jgi:hypothetical protein
MKIKRMVKRMSVVFTGALMLGATAMGALAADLNDYPNMFVDNGVFDGYFVVGENAASVDNLAMTDIAASMKYMEAGETSTVSVEGDVWKAETSTNQLEFRGDINDIETYIGDEDLAALADGAITNEKGTASYEQYLYFDGAYGSDGLVYAENDNDEVGVFFKIPATKEIARYYVDFTTQLKSDVDSSANMEDIENEVISLFGKDYTIVQAVNGTTRYLTLMGGSQKSSLVEGEELTYTVNDVEYTVQLQSVATYSSVDKVKFVVNGELTGALADGGTDKLEDGTVIGVTDITYQNYAGGIHSAEFFLGADKIKLQDGASLEVNDETIEEAVVNFTYTTPSGDFYLDAFEINMTADDDFYLAAGEKLSENVDLDEPEVLFTNNWDMEFYGLADVESSAVTFNTKGSDTKYDLIFSNNEGQEITMPLVFANTTGQYFGEKTGRELVFNKTAGISRYQYFVLNTADPTTVTNDAKSYVLQYTGADKCATDTNPKVKFKNIGSGETIERTCTTAGVFDIKLGGKTFAFDADGANKNGEINFTGGTDNAVIAPATGTSGNFSSTGIVAYNITVGWGLKLRTANNGLLRLFDPYRNESRGHVGGARTNGSTDRSAAILFVGLQTDDDNRKDDLTTDENLTFVFTYAASTDETNAAITSNTPAFWVSDPDENTITQGYTLYGTWAKQTAPSGSSRTIELSIPETQAKGEVYITSGATASSSSAGGVMTSVEVVDATKLDSEVADAMAQNLIVVGGPCVNTVAAELLGNPVDCTEGFTPGKARVKLFENGESVAMLVAGYSGADTRLAGKVIAQRYSELSGDEVEIEGTTTADASIEAPSVVEDVMEDVVEPVVDEPVVE